MWQLLTWSEVLRHYARGISFPREVDAVLRFLKEQCGAKHIGAVGFCWGGVATHYLTLQYPDVKAGVSVYGISEVSYSFHYSINKNSSIGLQDVILIMGFGAQSGPCAVVFAASFDDDLTVQGSSVKERTGTTSRVRRCSSLGKKMKLYLWTRSVCKHFKAFTNVHWYLSTKRYPLYAPDRFK